MQPRCSSGLAGGDECSGAAGRIGEGSIARLDDRKAIKRDPKPGYWVQVVGGIIARNRTEMREGDGAAITLENTLFIDADTEAEIRLIDLP
ncbi:pirin family protein [Sphingopyxis sp. RIFCSPHIGHO2_12_FULL_65_19]|uniref:pirin family protein n=1 Tax=Sphingopyxis sp. RIFCSPHIGHO2_12_FULL_65_19 TaxID=1802172 RepID=UPI0008B9FF30|nr:MAG: hypothetical protein A3E77_17960 [Sphingopyxis sp. RIFCSPHIGHO2_12_FULL_65_19]